MPFDTVEEKDSIYVANGTPVREILEFMSNYGGAKASIVDGHICIDYTRDETPAEKAARMEKKEKASLRNKANYQKMKEELKNKPTAERLAGVKRFKNPTSGDR